MQNSGELRNRLVAMLNLFPQWNRCEEMPMGNVDDPTSRSENLLDSTWHCDGEEAIARFLS